MKRRAIRHTREQHYSFEVYPPKTLRLAEVELSSTVDSKEAKQKIELLQKKLLERQVQHFSSKRRTIFVFEGWDAAGKGGAIKRITSPMDPRGFQVWPIGAPTSLEQGIHYLYRFFTRLPAPGTLSIFDRSWYGRVLVERVEGFASREEWQRAYDEINVFERMLTDDGVRLVKFFLHIDQATQLKRFRERETDPVKQYKIGPDDYRNRKKWKPYLTAYEEMFDRTHRPDAPWLVIPANDKHAARVQVLKAALACLGE